MAQDCITIVGAGEHNLKDLNLTIPRRAITVFTGVSGSGKTSLVFDTMAAEAGRQLNETFTAFIRNRLPSYGRPIVDAIEGLSPVVMIGQSRLGGNARSTVGTITDIYALLRLLFSRVGHPWIGESNAFSFNDPAGMCPGCSGLGYIVAADTDAFVDLDRSLQEGAILLPGFGNKPGNKRYWYRKYAESGLFDVTIPVRQWSAEDRHTLLYGGGAVARGLDGPVPSDYEGLVEHFNRIYIHTEGEMSARKQSVIDRFTTSSLCPDCGGDRLNQSAREVRVGGYTISECTKLEVTDLVALIRRVEEGGAGPVVSGLVERLEALVGIGLGYLHLGRATTTLSGGESQRIKMVRHLGSSLTEMLYVFDEPSIGLHPADVEQLNRLLLQLRDKGNTVVVVEHDPDVVAVADHVVELGPRAGVEGGTIVYEGAAEGLSRANTLTGRALRRPSVVRADVRRGKGVLAVTDAHRHNLHGLTIDVPREVLTVVTGVAGSGKSTLADVLLAQHPGGSVVDQRGVATSRRSNTATFAGIADRIRRLFARANDVPVSLFSANSAGACADCRGLGVIYTDLAFMDGVTAVCRECGGRGFTDEVLAYTFKGQSIADVLDRTVDEAQLVFDDPHISAVLGELSAVGLGYLALGQPMSTLSGGECQRIKLARELQSSPQNALYVLDEPTTGLHPTDVDQLLEVVDRLIDQGNTVVIIEHNLDVVRRADWVIDLGPGAGNHGGRVLFSGPPTELIDDPHSVTARYLRSSARSAVPV